MKTMKEFCRKWAKRIATKQMALIAIITLTATLIGMWAARFEGLKILGALIIALLIGMVVQFPIRAWYTKDDPQRAAGVKDAAGLIANKFLRFGIILLGFKLNLELLFTTGAKCLPLAALVVTVTVFVTYWICRWMGVDPLMAILVSCGTGICGAAAVMGVSGSIKVSRNVRARRRTTKSPQSQSSPLWAPSSHCSKSPFCRCSTSPSPRRASLQVAHSTKSPMPSQPAKASTVRFPPVRSMRPPWRTS